jgi:hypothetical protein
MFSVVGGFFVEHWKFRFLLTLSSVLVVASGARAEVVSFTLEDVILADGEQIFGTFDWTFDAGDFEDGVGEFTELDIPYTIYSFEDGNLNLEIQTNSIEISGNGNYHDVGLDISFFLSEPLVPTESSSIDLGMSFFECCGNGFKDQPFASGRITPLPEPSTFTAHLSGLAALWMLARRRKRHTITCC